MNGKYLQVESSHMVQRKSLSPGIKTVPPEFRKMFNDMRVMSGKPCRLEVVVGGNPRPKVSDQKIHLFVAGIKACSH